MKQVIVVMALVGSAVSWPNIAHATVVNGQTHVVVAPFEGHAGEHAYLSGAGFPAHRAVRLLLACPNIAAPKSSQGFTAVTTDAKGEFLAHRVTVSRPPGRGVIRCAFYAGLAGKSLAQAVPAPYQIVPAGKPLAVSALHITARVTASLVRLRSGAQGTIAVNGWPGARATVRIVSPGTATLTRTVRLNWRGASSFRLQVAPGLLKGVQAHVQADVNLGPYSGHATTHFIVVPGGR